MYSNIMFILSRWKISIIIGFLIQFNEHSVTNTIKSDTEHAIYKMLYIIV